MSKKLKYVKSFKTNVYDFELEIKRKHFFHFEINIFKDEKNIYELIAYI